MSLDTTATLWAIDKPGSCISHSKVRRACQKSLEGGLTGGASGTKACCRKPAQKNDPTSSKRGYVGLHSEVLNEKRRGRERGVKRTKRRLWLAVMMMMMIMACCVVMVMTRRYLMSICQRRLKPRCCSYWLRSVSCKKGTLCVTCCANGCAS